MRHYLTEQEFYGILTDLENGEVNIDCETSDGRIEHLRFRALVFFYKVILYSFPMTRDIGLIQEDADEPDGWNGPAHEVWQDMTDVCGWKPFIEKP